MGSRSPPASSPPPRSETASAAAASSTAAWHCSRSPRRHWIFWINVPIGLAAVLLGTRLLPESDRASERLDLAGVSLITAGVVALVWALTRANDVGWASAQVVGGLSGGCMLIAAFLLWEHRTAEPIVPPAMLSSRQFATGNLTTYFLHGALGKASGINYMAQRLGTVFALAIAVFAVAA